MLQLVSLATDSVDTTVTASASGGSIIGGLLGYLITAIALMGVFRKAGEPAWAAFVPFYNLYVTTRVAGYNPWMFILLLIPLVNFVFAIFVALGIGRAFGKGAVFSIVLLWLLSVIGYFIVGYGDARFIGRGGNRSLTA